MSNKLRQRYSRFNGKTTEDEKRSKVSRCMNQISPPTTPLQNPCLRSRRQPYVLQVRKVAGNHPGKDIFRDILGVHSRFCEQPEQRDVGELGELMVADLPQQARALRRLHDRAQGVEPL